MLKNYYTHKDARDYACNLHAERNLRYGEEDLPYSYHLHKVAWEVKVNAYNYFTYAECGILEKAAWLHDTIEDCAITYNDIKTIFGEVVADIVYAVSNELGKNRNERAERTYPKIAKGRYSVFIKLCDRIANMKYSKERGSSMYKKYKRELPHFLESICVEWKFPELEQKLLNL